MAGKTGTTQRNTDGWFILMHPNLVAGAWVGFNDTRVTMRSNYWGQGGHNAILLVGDFYREAFTSGKLDAKVLFPGGRKAPPPPPAPVEDDVAPGEWDEPPEDVSEDPPPEPEPEPPPVEEEDVPVREPSETLPPPNPVGV